MSFQPGYRVGASSAPIRITDQPDHPALSDAATRLLEARREGLEDETRDLTERAAELRGEWQALRDGVKDGSISPREYRRRAEHLTRDVRLLKQRREGLDRTRAELDEAGSDPARYEAILRQRFPSAFAWNGRERVPARAPKE